MAAIAKRKSIVQDVAAIKQAAQGRWPRAITDLSGLSQDVADGQHHACPKRCHPDAGGKDRFRVFNDYAESGGMICNQCGVCSDGIAALQWLTGDDFKTTIQKLADYLGVKPLADKSGDPEKDLEFLEWSSALVPYFASRRMEGIPAEQVKAALLAMGARRAKYKRRFAVYAIPIVGSGLNVDKPDGWIVLDAMGGTVPKWDKSGKEVGAVKAKLVYGSKPGLVNLHAIERLATEGLVDMLWKVEGVTDALALWIAIPEKLRDRHVVVTNSNGCKQKPKWMASVLAHGKPHVVHDADKPGEAGARLWAQEISRNGVDTVMVRLPYEVTGSHGKDLRDWLREGNTYDDLLELARQGELCFPEPEDSTQKKKSKSDKLDPSNLKADQEANRFIEGVTADGVSKVRYWNGLWWRWQGAQYIRLRDDEVRADVLNGINLLFEGVGRSRVSDVMEQLQAKTILPSAIESPAWLGGVSNRKNGQYSPPATECLAFLNGILHLPSLFSGGEFLMPPTPRLLTTAACDYNFNNGAPEPKAWFKFLAEVWEDDQQTIDTLQEIAGYLLTTDTSQQRIFLLLGPTRSGKGTITRMLRRLVGEANICGPTLASLGTNFGLSALLGKSVAIISDARLSSRADQAVVLERLLSISGEDPLSIDLKFKTPVTTKLPTRLLMLSNELPRLADASSAITGRFLVLRMTRSFLGKEDRQLDSKIAAELPSILLWACEGWRRLHERGYFLQPDSAIELLSDLRDLASPVTAFVRDCCEIAPGACAAVSHVFDEWKSWCLSQGREHPGTVQSFGRDLIAAFPGVTTRQRRANGDRKRFYEGIQITNVD